MTGTMGYKSLSVLATGSVLVHAYYVGAQCHVPRRRVSFWPHRVMRGTISRHLQRPSYLARHKNGAVDGRKHGPRGCTPRGCRVHSFPPRRGTVSPWHCRPALQAGTTLNVTFEPAYSASLIKCVVGFQSSGERHPPSRGVAIRSVWIRREGRVPAPAREGYLPPAASRRDKDVQMCCVDGEYPDVPRSRK